MAGKGPAPAETKRRRNKKRVDELPAEGNTRAFPRLPRDYRTSCDGKVVKVVFLKATRDWYEAWARSPMAVQFTAVDYQRLQRVARIVDQYERHPDPKLLAELRLQESAFGGSPLDRLRLGLKVATPPAPGDRAREQRPRSQPSARRARLSVVK